MTNSELRRGPTMSVYLAVWGALLVIVAIEVSLAYAHVSTGRLLVMLLMLAVLEGGIAVRYFMHLRYDPPLLFWTVIPAVVFALIMMNQLWADAHRVSALRFPGR
jgi:caa(3)-type oxidase subunit IV